jgi:hypothetical protein
MLYLGMNLSFISDIFLPLLYLKSSMKLLLLENNGIIRGAMRFPFSFSGNYANPSGL